MYSKARLAGHPIHPMLVAFPIAFYAATVACEVAFTATGDAFWFRAAMVTNIAGVVMAIVALIPGAIDLAALPARSRARATAYRHAGANVASTGAFAVSAGVLWHTWRALAPLTVALPLALGALGLVALGVAGVLGFRLVQRHHVGVRPTRLVTTGTLRRLSELDDLDEVPPRTLRHTDVERPVPVTWH